MLARVGHGEEVSSCALAEALVPRALDIVTANAMDLLEGACVIETDLLRCNADDGAELEVQLMNVVSSASGNGLFLEPQTCQRGVPRPRDSPKRGQVRSPDYLGIMLAAYLRPRDVRVESLTLTSHPASNAAPIIERMA